MTAPLIPPHGILHQWTTLYGPHTEAPVEAHLGAAIALISAGIGWKTFIRWSGNYEPCTVNVVLEGGSAVAKKTTVANTAHGLAREACSDQDREYRRLFTHTIGHTSDAGLIDLVSYADQAEADRYENTPPPGHLIVWDEFGNILGDAGTQRKGGDWLGRVRTTIMGLTNGRHGGSATRVDKKAGGRCAVAILATMTRIELEERVDTGLLRDGFLGRFALVPLSGDVPILAIPPRWDGGMGERRSDIVTWLRRLADRGEPYGEAFELMTSDATKSRIEWYVTRTQRLRDLAAADPSETNISRHEAFGRLQSLAIKVAAVHAVSRLDDPLGPLTIDLEAIDYGQAMADLCLAEISLLASESAQGHPADEWGKRFLQWLARQDGSAATKRDVDRGLQSRKLSPAQRWMIVEGLHSTGDVAITKGKARNGRDQIRVQLLADVSGMSVTSDVSNGLSHVMPA